MIYVILKIPLIEGCHVFYPRENRKASNLAHNPKEASSLFIFNLLQYSYTKQARSQTIEIGGAHTYKKKLAPNHGWAPEKKLNLRSPKIKIL